MARGQRDRALGRIRVGHAERHRGVRPSVSGRSQVTAACGKWAVRAWSGWERRHPLPVHRGFGLRRSQKRLRRGAHRIGAESRRTTQKSAGRGQPTPSTIIHRMLIQKLPTLERVLSGQHSRRKRGSVPARSANPGSRGSRWLPPGIAACDYRYSESYPQGLRTGPPEIDTPVRHSATCQTRMMHTMFIVCSQAPQIPSA
jgi:hypothetical protein